MEADPRCLTDLAADRGARLLFIATGRSTAGRGGAGGRVQRGRAPWPPAPAKPPRQATPKPRLQEVERKSGFQGAEPQPATRAAPVLP